MSQKPRARSASPPQRKSLVAPLYRAVDYARIAKRGTVDMTNAVNPPELANAHGLTESGRFESAINTAAPVARWMVFKEEDNLCL